MANQGILSEAWISLQTFEGILCQCHQKKKTGNACNREYRKHALNESKWNNFIYINHDAGQQLCYPWIFYISCPVP